MIVLVNIYFRFSEIIVSDRETMGIIGCFGGGDSNPASVLTAFQF